RSRPAATARRACRLLAPRRPPAAPPPRSARAALDLPPARRPVPGQAARGRLTTQRPSLSLSETLRLAKFYFLLAVALAACSPKTYALRQVADAISSTGDRKSTRLNSSHVAISYAVF